MYNFNRTINVSDDITVRILNQRITCPEFLTLSSFPCICFIQTILPKNIALYLSYSHNKVMLNIFKKIIQNLPLFQILQNLLFNFDLQLLLQTLNSRFYTEKRKKKKMFFALTSRSKFLINAWLSYHFALGIRQLIRIDEHRWILSSQVRSSPFTRGSSSSQPRIFDQFLASSLTRVLAFTL